MKPNAGMAFLFAVIVVTVLSGFSLVFPHATIMADDAVPDVHNAPQSPTAVPVVDVEIVIREGGHPLLKGKQVHGHMIMLVAGEPIVLALRNEDTGPRDFVSPLFTRTEMHFVGRATGIFRKEAVGFRLKPGDTLTLQFMAPYTGFPRMYDLIWCSHEEQPAAEAQELLIVMTEER